MILILSVIFVENTNFHFDSDTEFLHEDTMPLDTDEDYVDKHTKIPHLILQSELNDLVRFEFNKESSRNPRIETSGMEPIIIPYVLMYTYDHRRKQGGRRGACAPS